MTTAPTALIGQHGDNWISLRVLILALLATMGLGAIVPHLATADSPGAAELLLDGGSSGQVPFPHLRHQQVLKECTQCHETFPREKGAIGRLKAQGALQPKQVMNKLCTACHKQKKAAGEKTGPITCTQCHQKS